MANTFKNASVAVLTTSTDVYQCPTAVGSSAVIFSLLASNVDGVNPVDITLEVYDDSGTVTRTLANKLPLPVGSTLDFAKVALEPDDILRAKSTANSDVEIFASILEITP